MNPDGSPPSGLPDPRPHLDPFADRTTDLQPPPAPPPPTTTANVPPQCPDVLMWHTLLHFREDRAPRGDRSWREGQLRPQQLSAADLLRPSPLQAWRSGGLNIRLCADVRSPSITRLQGVDVDSNLAEHRLEFGVEPDRPYFLRTAARSSDLGSPLQRVLA